jgi:hypothetical protein
VVFGVMVLLGCVLYLYKKETLNIIIVNINLKSKLFISLYSIVLLIVTAYFFIGIHGSIKDSKNKNLLRYCFQTYERQPDSILGLFHFNNLEYFYEIANKLEANKLNIFYDNPYDKEENNIQIKKLENPNEYLEFTKFDMVGIDNKEYISINGIIYKNNNIRNYDKVIGVFENNKYICYSNISNPFIKTLPKRKRDKRGGFLCNIPFKTLKKGKYAFKIQFVNKENTIAYEINPNITLIIDNNILIIKSISPL